ncbi:MAG: hypothetical protein JO332_01255 [Planctomycetaceae bacterium]|nr:hypothetical protein [Planctomycetaceae bacterium]
MSLRRFAPCLAVVLSAASSTLVHADERKFTYSYEAKTLPKGSWEFEQWATLKMEKDAGDYNRLELREEFEVGLTDRLTTAFYLNTTYQATRNVPGLDDEHRYGFESISSEWKYKLTDPSADILGTLLYGELLMSSDEYELEAKLVVSKELGDFTFAYNFIYEAELEREVGESPEWRWAHIIQNTVGVSYLLPFLRGAAIGAEARSEAHFERSFSGEHNSAYWAGPNVHYAAGTWWMTLTFLTQLNIHDLEFDETGNTKYELRLIFGVNF